MPLSFSLLPHQLPVYPKARYATCKPILPLLALSLCVCVCVNRQPPFDKIGCSGTPFILGCVLMEGRWVRMDDITKEGEEASRFA